MTTVRLLVLAAVAAAVIAVCGVATSSAQPQSSGPPDEYVAAWDDIGTRAFTAAALTPAEGHTIFAYVGIAVYDAVMAVEGGYEPFAVDVDAPEQTSAQAAVAAAAHRVLRHYLPGQAAMLDTELGLSLGSIGDGMAKTNGIAFGEAVASLVHPPAFGRRVPCVDAALRARARAGRLGADGDDATNRPVPRRRPAVQPRLC